MAPEHSVEQGMRPPALRSFLLSWVRVFPPATWHCFVILPVGLEIVTFCKDRINRQLWEHLVAKLLMPGALELSLEAPAVEEGTETRCLVSWMSHLTPELFYKRKPLTLSGSSPSGVMGEKVAVLFLDACARPAFCLLKFSPFGVSSWASNITGHFGNSWVSFVLYINIVLKSR